MGAHRAGSRRTISQLIGEALQATARVEDVAVMPGLSRLQTDILERWNAEERASLGRTIRNLFDDPRRASASVSVSVVASLFLAMGAFLLAQSPIRHPESLKAAMTLSSRARTADIYLPAVEMMPRVQAEAIMPATVMNRDDEEVAFAGARDCRWLSRGCGIHRRPHSGAPQSADACAAVRAAQCRRDRALRARPRRWRSRLSECRLARLAHDRARPAARATSTCASTAGRCSSSLR